MHATGIAFNTKVLAHMCLLLLSQVHTRTMGATDVGILRLNDDSLEGILRAARPVHVLFALASTCRRLRDVARSRVAEQFSINSAADAAALIKYGPSFTACKELWVSIKDDATFKMLPEVLLAAAKWDNLISLNLEIRHSDIPITPDLQLEDIDHHLSESLRPLPGLKHLQDMWLLTSVFGASMAACVGSLQQLTWLGLGQEDGPQEWIGTVNYRARPQDLSALSHLVSLQVLRVVADESTAPLPPEAAGGCCLPSSLQTLQLEKESIPYWLQHLAGCPRLVDLYVQNLDDQHALAHPASVLKQVASSAPWLRTMTFDGLYQEDYAPRYDLELPLLPDAEPPMGDCLHEPLPELRSLEYLDAGGCLPIRHAADWEALRSLRALTSLLEVDVFCAPHEQWQHLEVREVSLKLQGLTGQGAGQVLLGFPSVKDAVVTVRQPAVSSAASASQGIVALQGVPQQLSGLTCLDLRSQGVGCSISPAAHVTPMLIAARGVLQLSLTWECSPVSPGAVGPQLPDLSCLTAVTQLELRQATHADEEDVMCMLQPLAPTLRVLKLSCVKCMSPRATLGLQSMLGHLEGVHFRQCRSMRIEGGSSRSESEQLQLMRQLLRPGLTVTATRW